MTEHKIDIEQIAKDLADKTGSDNLLNFCETDENGHTKFLHEILRRGIEGGYPCFLESFFKILNEATTRSEGEDEASGNEEPSFFDASARENLQLRNQYKYIDELITFNEHDGTIAVIIENKACRAPDQNNQLDRYICVCSQGPCTCERKRTTEKEIALHLPKEINAEKIFVVYLTKDGGEPPETSLSENKKKSIETQRPICINYKDDILPWLKEDVLPECKQKDAGFIRSLQMYIDFLEGFVYEKALSPEVEKKLSEVLKEKLEVKFEKTDADGWRASKEKLEQFENAYKMLKPQKHTEEEKTATQEDLKTAAQADFIATQLSYFYAKPANAFKRLSDEYWDNKFPRKETPDGDEMATNIKKSIGWNSKYIWYGKRMWNNKEQRIHVEWVVFPDGDYDEKAEKTEVNRAGTLFEALYKMKLSNIWLRIHFEGRELGHAKEKSPLKGRGMWLPPKNWEDDRNAIDEVAGFQKSMHIVDEDKKNNEALGKIDLGRTFADLDEAERRTFLTALYDKAAEGLNFVYDKMEEHK